MRMHGLTKYLCIQQGIVPPVLRSNEISLSLSLSLSLSFCLSLSLSVSVSLSLFLSLSLSLPVIPSLSSDSSCMLLRAHIAISLSYKIRTSIHADVRHSITSLLTIPFRCPPFRYIIHGPSSIRPAPLVLISCPPDAIFRPPIAFSYARRKFL